MIFDNPRLLKLQQKYSLQPDYRVPRLALLARLEELAGERDYLEELIGKAAPAQQKAWLSRFLDTNDVNHFSVWFEIMLFGWLEENTIGEVSIEPKIEGNDPDFTLKTGRTEKEVLVIEAQALMAPVQETRYFLCRAEIVKILTGMPKPCQIEMLEFVFNDEFDLREFEREARRWFAECPGSIFSYRDKHRSWLKLKVSQPAALEKVIVNVPSREALTTLHLDRPIRNKATQHQALRKAGYPYLIALLIENWNYSLSELVTSWFGNVEIDEQGLTKIDKNGQRFAGVDIRHTSVGGTLVFQMHYNSKKKRRELLAYYLQNPFALSPLDITKFKVAKVFRVKSENVDNFEMFWG